MRLIKKILIVLSVVVNVIFVLFIVLSLPGKTSSVSFYRHDNEAVRYTSGACVVSVPAEDANLVFGPVEFSLTSGAEAALQFSVFLDGRQMNLALNPLYDREVISLEQSGYGLIIRGKAAGLTVLQVLTETGIRDIARITVTEAP